MVFPIAYVAVSNVGIAGLIWALARFTGRDGSKNVIRTDAANR